MADYYSDEDLYEEDVYEGNGMHIPVNQDAKELTFGIEPRPGTLYERRRQPKQAARAKKTVQYQNRDGSFSWNWLFFLVFLGLGVSALYKSAQSDLAPGSSFSVSFSHLWDDFRPSETVEVAYEEESEELDEDEDDQETEADMPVFTVDDPYQLANLLNVLPEVNEVLRLRISMLGIYERLKKGNKAAQNLHEILSNAVGLRPEPSRPSSDGRYPPETIFEQDIIRIDDQISKLYRQAENLWESVTEKTYEHLLGIETLAIYAQNSLTPQQRAWIGGQIGVSLAKLTSIQSTQAESLINEMQKAKLFTTAAIDSLKWPAHPSEANERDPSRFKMNNLGMKTYWHSLLTPYRHLFPRKGGDEYDFETIVTALGNYYNDLSGAENELNNLLRALGTLKAKADAVKDYVDAGESLLVDDDDIEKSIELYASSWRWSKESIEKPVYIYRREEGLLWHYYIRRGARFVDLYDMQEIGGRG